MEYANGTATSMHAELLEHGTAMPWWDAPLKLVATLLSSISGIPGGLFAPSLSVGAGLGPALATVLPTLELRALSLLAMVAYFAGVVQAPLTAFVIVLEMSEGSRDGRSHYMATALLATGASRLVCPIPSTMCCRGTSHLGWVETVLAAAAYHGPEPLDARGSGG